jgi:acetylornithine deacetylase/succinyl-diaminopimelate desuccinylase-like protein
MPVLAPAHSGANDVVALLSQLVATDSAVGTSGEAAQRLLGTYLASAGFDVDYSVDDPTSDARHPEYTAPPPGQPPINLVAVPRGARSRLALFAHIDTEPLRAPLQQQQLRATVKGGRIYGLGSADDKSGVAAAAVAAAALVTAGAPAPIVMSLHGKGGGARGTLRAFARASDIAGALYVHPAETGLGLRQIKHASRGVIDLTLTITGWHGSMREIGTPESAPFAEGGDALRAGLTVVDRLRHSAFAGCEVNVGRVVAGDRPGVVPRTCELSVRVLFDAPRNTAALLAAAEGDIAQCEQELESATRRFSIVSAVPLRANPAATDWDDPLCRIVRRAVTRVTGIEPGPYAAHLASDVRFPILVARCPAVGVGCVAGGFYGPDEWVDIDDLHRLVRVLGSAAQAWNDLEEP